MCLFVILDLLITCILFRVREIIQVALRNIEFLVQLPGSHMDGIIDYMDQREFRRHDKVIDRAAKPERVYVIEG